MRLTRIQGSIHNGFILSLVFNKGYIMLKYIRRFNKWYDKLEEPYRFLLAMALAIVPITLIAFDRQVLGGTCLLVLISIRVIK